MIVKSIVAQNVLKYRTLELNEIPETGLIAISGPNESGKSTIGETLCFAFFGRTFSLTEVDLHKIIRWGETNCSVTIEFEVDGVGYTLNRSLDNQGNQSARLSRADKSDQPLVRGVDAVNLTLFELLGYAFDEFIESFYLAQREISTPHPQSQAVKIMAGIAPLEQVSLLMTREIEQENEQLQGIDAEIANNKADYQNLGLESGKMALMQERREGLTQAAEESAQAEESLARISARYIIALPKWQQERRRRALLRLVSIISLILTVVAGGLWALLAFGPEYQAVLAEQARSLLFPVFPGFQDRHVAWVGYVAVGLAVLTSILWIGMARRSRRIRELTDVGVQFSQLLATTQDVRNDVTDEEAREIEIGLTEPIPIDESAGANDVAADESEQHEVQSSVNLSAVERADHTAFFTIHNQVSQMTASAVAVCDYTEVEQAWLKALLVRQNAALAALDAQIAEEQIQLQNAEHLLEIGQGLGHKRSAAMNQIVLREAALDLIEGNTDYLSSRFNRDLKDQVGHTLRLFTNGRYEHLQISEDFKVRVFSVEKRDFMDLDEVSSGTQRQIMLAIRLTLAEQLLTRAVKGRQFVFLDEPFAFFDEIRTQESLRGLTRFSATASQIFIVAQTFPNEDVDFALKIDCNNDQQEMTMASTTRGEPGQLPFTPESSSSEETPATNNMAETEDKS